MTNTQTNPITVPWYRVRIMWLIVAIPFLCVTGCLLTIYLALSNPDYLVSDVDEASTKVSQARP